MRKLLLVAAVALLFPLAASAQVGIGAKLGLGIPMGEADQGENLSDISSLEIPLELSLDLGVTPQLKLGVYGGWAWAKTGSTVQDSCDFYGDDCSQHSWRLGAKGEYALGEGGPWVPYVGANFGWEWHITKIAHGGNWAKVDINGWELGFEGGADTKVSEQLSAGLFVNLTFGRYGEIKTTYSSGPSNTTNIPSDFRTTHAWLTLGVRGNFELTPAHQ